MAGLVTYLVPIRSASMASEELLSYLQRLATLSSVNHVIVVDGSDPEVFADFHTRAGGAIRHVKVDADLLSLANGKVAGVLTGLRIAGDEYLVIADDDVRYDEAGLQAVSRALDQAEVVRPQNYFDPLPWHACVDTARTLINRVTGGDWPGTLGVRRSALLRTGGYDGNVLFENLELVRTITAAGGREARPLDLFVRRLPAETDRFWSQRVRQAYDELARPARLGVSLALLPTIVVLARKYGAAGVAVAAMAPVVVAEAGRRAGRGVSVFPVAATLVAPLWVLERAVCVWLAVGSRLVLGGIPYRGRVLRRAATSYQTLARKHSGRPDDGRGAATSAEG